MKLESQTLKRGQYRGIAVELAPPHSHYKWCAYIILQLDQLPEEIAEQLWLEPEFSGSEEFPRYSYPYMSNLPGELPMHGGCTYYEKKLGDWRKVPGERRMVKLGCDYNHFNDSDCTDEASVAFDIKETIDWIHANWTYKVQCRGNGKLYNESEGTYKNEWFYSNEYEQSKEGQK